MNMHAERQRSQHGGSVVTTSSQSGPKEQGKSSADAHGCARQFKKYLFAGFCALALPAAVNGQADHVFFNEFHYDNAGADTGEFIEIAVRNDREFNPSFVTLTLYNGATGASYGTPTPLTAFTASSPFSIAGTSTTVRFLTLSFASESLINGQGGFALNVNQGPAAGRLLTFLSYGGSFTATDGLAMGKVSTDVGVTESSLTPAGASLGLTGAGIRALNFIWANNADDTPGAPNIGQTFSVPDSGSTYEMLTAAMILLIGTVTFNASSTPPPSQPLNISTRMRESEMQKLS